MQLKTFLLLLVAGVTASSTPAHHRNSGRRSCPLPTASSLSVNTSQGLVHGTTDPTTPCVREFLGIPYAKPPINHLRFRPPQPAGPFPGGVFNATKFGPSCMQFLIDEPESIYTEFVPEFNLEGISTTSNHLSEDCLSVSVYTPSAAAANRTKLPVIAFIHGGAFTVSGQDAPYTIPRQWVQKSQSHIVVTFNYRLNIFGFPSAEGLPLEDQNLGLQDQRLALEWTKKNIASFGGDPSRIALWGQSAGALAAGWYQYARDTLEKDPIVDAIMMDSGTEIFPLSRSVLSESKSNFTAVAEKFGCNHTTPEEELRCMQTVDAQDIEFFLEDNMSKFLSGKLGKEPIVFFTPVINNVTVFANYSERAEQKKILNVPTIIGTNTNDGVPFVPLTPNGVNGTLEEAVTMGFFLCPAFKAASFRLAAGVPVYRYIYTANFTNISPAPFLGAYHGAELPLLFGTDEIARGASTPDEKKLSKIMEDAWVALASKGTQGIEATGWSRYTSVKNGLVRNFGGNPPTPTNNTTTHAVGSPLVTDISLSAMEALCPNIFQPAFQL